RSLVRECERNPSPAPGGRPAVSAARSFRFHCAPLPRVFPPDSLPVRFRSIWSDCRTICEDPEPEWEIAGLYLPYSFPHDSGQMIRMIRTNSTSARITNKEERTTELVAVRPTPSVPPLVRMPWKHDTNPMITPNTEVFSIGGI